MIECGFSVKLERRKSIQQYIESSGEVTLRQLEEMHPACSTMTLRRDLIALEEAGVLRRTRGGAVAMSRLGVNSEDVYNRRAMQRVQEKIQVAQKCLGLIESGCALYLDSGSTIMQLVKILPSEHLSVVTSGANIALELLKKSGATVTLLGGQINPNTLSVSGALTLQMIEQFNIDTAVMACSGFDPETGFTSGSFNEHELKRAVIQKARRVFMLMDSSKIMRSMPFTFAKLPDIDVLICDRALPQNILKQARACHVQAL